MFNHLKMDTIDHLSPAELGAELTWISDYSRKCEKK